MKREAMTGLLGRLGVPALICALAVVAMGCGETTAPVPTSVPAQTGDSSPPPPPTTGSILVSTVTLGGGIDSDFNSYSIQLGREPVATVGANASALISGLNEGTYSVKLTNTSNCLIPNGNPRSMTVVAGRIARTIFRVHC